MSELKQELIKVVFDAVLIKALSVPETTYPEIQLKRFQRYKGYIGSFLSNLTIFKTNAEIIDLSRSGKLYSLWVEYIQKSSKGRLASMSKTNWASYLQEYLSTSSDQNLLALSHGIRASAESGLSKYDITIKFRDEFDLEIEKNWLNRKLQALTKKKVLIATTVHRTKYYNISPGDHEQQKKILESAVESLASIKRFLQLSEG